jgi:hypothetical protein
MRSPVNALNRFLLVAVLVLANGMLLGMFDTGAWFTDAASAQGPVLTSGSLDLQVTGGPLMAAALVPGDPFTPMGSFCVQNTGNLPLKLRGVFAANQASAGLVDYLSMRVERQAGSEWGLEREINPGELGAYFRFAGQLPVTAGAYVLSGQLDPGAQACYRFASRLDGNAPDSLQAARLSFALALHATQINNPGWE